MALSQLTNEPRKMLDSLLNRLKKSPPTARNVGAAEHWRGMARPHPGNPQDGRPIRCGKTSQEISRDSAGPFDAGNRWCPKGKWLFYGKTFKAGTVEGKSNNWRATESCAILNRLGEKERADILKAVVESSRKSAGRVTY